MTSIRYSVEALTDLWTGDWKGSPQYLLTTGLLGSIRWWFEVVVRGLGGTACDPSNRRVRCPASAGGRCVTCELFGCTAWARKFRFDVFDASGSVRREQVTKGSHVQLCFTPLRPVQNEEWALLDVTIRLIAGYGAIGGKTVYKPSDEAALADAGLEDFNDALVLQRQIPRSPIKRNDTLLRIEGVDVRSKSTIRGHLENRATGDPVDIDVERNGARVTVAGWVGKRHHQDYGLVNIVRMPQLTRVPLGPMQAYLRDDSWRQVEPGGFGWASLANFWCVNGRYLTRQNADHSTFNRIIGRPEPKHRSSRGDSWLAGRRAGNGRDPESKKVFSSRQPARTFGFTSAEEAAFNGIKNALKSAWPNLRDEEVQGGNDILRELVGGAGQ